MLRGGLWFMVLFCLGCGSRPPTQQPVVANHAEPPRAAPAPKRLHDSATELRDAAEGRGDLSSMVPDDERIVTVSFRCAVADARTPDSTMAMNRERIVATLAHARVADEPTCDEGTRCCSFVRARSAPRGQVSLESACFDADASLRSLRIVDDDSCHG